MAERLSVQAKRLGVYQGKRRRPGEKFAIKNLQEFSYRWMKPLGWTPPERPVVKRTAPLPNPVGPGARKGYLPQAGTGLMHPVQVEARKDAAAPLVVIDKDPPKAKADKKPVKAAVKTAKKAAKKKGKKK